MHDNKRLEDDGPGGVAQAVLQGAEDLSDAGLAGMGGDQDVLDIFALGGSELWFGGAVSGWALSRLALARARKGAGGRGRLALILVAPFTDFSKELDISRASHAAASNGTGEVDGRREAAVGRGGRDNRCSSKQLAWVAWDGEGSASLRARVREQFISRPTQLLLHPHAPAESPSHPNVAPQLPNAL